MRRAWGDRRRSAPTSLMKEKKNNLNIQTSALYEILEAYWLSGVCYNLYYARQRGPFLKQTFHEFYASIYLKLDYLCRCLHEVRQLVCLSIELEDSRSPIPLLIVRKLLSTLII